MMRSLVVTLNAATAASGGAGMRNAQTIRSLARHGPVDVVSLGVTDPASVADASDVLLWSWEDLRRLQGRSHRMWLRMWPVRRGGHWRQDMYVARQALQTVGDLVRRHNHDLIVAATWQTGPYALKERRGRRFVFDTHNIEADLRPTIEDPVAGGRAALTNRIDRRRLRLLEQRLGDQADQVWTCSDEDRRLWRAVHGEAARISVVPNTVAVPEVTGGDAERSSARLLLTGTFSYPPNIDAARELVTEIFPRIQGRLPEATVDLVGREPTPEISALGRPGGQITVVGAVADMTPYLSRSSVLVVPLRSGGGTRLKILEAMAAGLPVVSTPKGAEGIAIVDGQHLLLRNSSQEIADAAVQICTDPHLARSLAREARALVVDRYGTTALDCAIDSALGQMELA